jgi:hypothetical protein
MAAVRGPSVARRSPGRALQQGRHQALRSNHDVSRRGPRILGAPCSQLSCCTLNLGGLLRRPRTRRVVRYEFAPVRLARVWRVARTRICGNWLLLRTTVECDPDQPRSVPTCATA